MWASGNYWHGKGYSGNRTIQAKTKVTGRNMRWGNDQTPQGTTEVCLWHGCLLACRYTANAYLQPMVSWFSSCIFLSITPFWIAVSIKWWLVIYLSNMSSCTYFTSSSVDTMTQTSHTNKTVSTVNLSKMYPIQAVTRLVWNCIFFADTDTSGSSHKCY